jgi:hypothetical protein
MFSSFKRIWIGKLADQQRVSQKDIFMAPLYYICYLKWFAFDTLNIVFFLLPMDLSLRAFVSNILQAKSLLATLREEIFREREGNSKRRCVH